MIIHALLLKFHLYKYSGCLMGIYDSRTSGQPVIDELIIVLLNTSMFIGGGVAFFLDNTIPGNIIIISV